MDEIKIMHEINKESRKRVRRFIFGDLVTNICASNKNPTWHCYFVRNKKNTVECKDQKGGFHDIDIDVIYPGHLSVDQCDELYLPILRATI